MASRVVVALRVEASPERAFRAFTREIGRWWRPNHLFQFHPEGTGELSFEPGPGGRLTERLSTGGAFEIGRISVWDPPKRLAFTWRPASFAPDEETRVTVTFEPIEGETRVTVEHTGWDALPRAHAARHGFPLPVFQQRLAEWWQVLLAEIGRTIGCDSA